MLNLFVLLIISIVSGLRTSLISLKQHEARPHGLLTFIENVIYPQTDQASAVLGEDVEEVFNPRLSLGTSSPYLPAPGGYYHPSEESIELIQLHYYSRHGTRFPTDSMTGKMLDLVSTLKKNHSLLFKDFHLGFDDNDAGLLAPSGKLSVKTTALRLKHRYNHTSLFTPFKHTNNSIKIYSSMTERVKKSAEVFLASLVSHSKSHPLPPISILQNRTLDADCNPIKSCNVWIEASESDEGDGGSANGEIWKEQWIQETANRISTNIGGGKVHLSNKEALTFLQICAFQLSLNSTLNVNSPDGICKFLNERKDFENFAVLSDMEKYYEEGYGNRRNGNLGCSAITGIVNAIKGYKGRASVTPNVTIHFAHAETILPLLTTLDLYKDSFLLTGNLTLNGNDDKLRNRKWQTSFISSFEANVMFEVYMGKQGSIFLRVLTNEVPIKLPGCSSFLCPFEEFLMIYKEKIGCDYDQVCQNSWKTLGGWDGWQGQAH